MINFCLFLLLLSFSSALVHVTVTAFVSPVAHGGKSSLSMALMKAPPPESSIIAPAGKQASVTASSPIGNGIGRFIAQEPSAAIMTSTNVLSLKDRPPPPTPEEIAAKKRTFNLWFWGGGFVAPFLATFYYFGLKFWER